MTNPMPEVSCKALSFCRASTQIVSKKVPIPVVYLPNAAGRGPARAPAAADRTQFDRGAGRCGHREMGRAAQAR